MKFFENLSKIGNFRNFPKFWTKWNFYKNSSKSEIFLENLTKNEIFRKFDLTKIEIFEKFFEIFENFEQNRNFYNSSKIEIFWKIWLKSNFLGKFWPKSKFFRKFD